MQVHYGISAFRPLPRAAVTSGTFDGVHLGHQHILQRLKEVGQAHQAETVLLTFWPHPRYVLQPEASAQLRLLNSLPEKIERVGRMGIDHLIVLPFDKAFSQKSSMEFISEILVQGIHTTQLVIGYDHRFGRNREGGFDYLREHGHLFGFEVEEIPAQAVQQVTVSSTKIREALALGDVQQANRYLGSPYPISGTVVQGNQLGRTLGFPTANLQPEDAHKALPAPGVYALRTQLQGRTYGGMLNIGVRPTLGNGLHTSIEAHLFDFSGDLYGQRLQLELIGRLRDEMRFEGLAALQNQLLKDEQHARALLLAQ